MTITSVTLMYANIVRNVAKMLDPDENEVVEQSNEDDAEDDITSQTLKKITFPVKSILNAVIQDGDAGELYEILNLRLSEININQTNHSGLTPLHYAVLTKNLDSIKMLITFGADVNAQDMYGFTPLHTAAALGYIHVTSMLILFGADVFSLTHYKELPIDLAKDMSVIRLLMYEMCNRFHRENRFRSLVFFYLKSTAILFLFKFLFMRISIHMEPYVKMLDPDENEVVEQSNENDAEDDITSQTLKKITFPVKSILNAVIQDGDAGELYELSNLRLSEININQTNHSGLTPLHYAVLTKNLDSIKMLITFGADVNAQDMYGFTPLHTAAAMGYIHVTSMLILFGADVFSLTHYKELPIDLAKDMSVIRLLMYEMCNRFHRENRFRSE
ncbi:ANR52-like protein, partial [Mya arenaria]